MRAHRIAVVVAASILATACGASGEPSTVTSLVEGVGGGSVAAISDPPPLATTTVPSPSGTVPPEVTAVPAPSQPQVAGTVSWVVVGEPVSLLDGDADAVVSTSAWTASWIRQALLPGLFGGDENGAASPELLATFGEVVADPLGRYRERHRLREDLVWSDGRPLGTRDVLFTLEIARAGRDLAELEGLAVPEALDALAEAVRVSGEEFDLVWDPWVASAPGLLATVLPAHQFSADPRDAVTEVITALATGMTPRGPLASSGPMMIESWLQGSGMRLVHNPGHRTASARRSSEDGLSPAVVTITFVADEDEARSALERGLGDVTVLAGSMGVVEVVENESVLEEHPWPRDVIHVAEFRFGSLHLDVHGTRRGIGAILDRRRIAAVGTPGAIPAGSLRRAPWRAPEIDHPATGGLGLGDIGFAAEILAETGYRLDDDGILTHPFIGYLEVAVASAPGADPAVAAEIVAQLGSVGVLVEAVEDPEEADLVVHRTALDRFGHWPEGILDGGAGAIDGATETSGAAESIRRRVARCADEVTAAWEACLDDLDDSVSAGGEAIDEAVRWFPLRAESSALLVVPEAVQGLVTVADGPWGGPLQHLTQLRSLR